MTNKAKAIMSIVALGAAVIFVVLACDRDRDDDHPTRPPVVVHDTVYVQVPCPCECDDKR